MNATIEYIIKLNTGDARGEQVSIVTDIEELEEEPLSSQLISQGYLDFWCNDGEYTVIDRKVIISE